MRDLIAAECIGLIDQHFLNDGGIAYVKDVRSAPFIARNGLLVGGAGISLDVIAPERPQHREPTQRLRWRIERHEIGISQHLARLDRHRHRESQIISASPSFGAAEACGLTQG
jgi:hypothetical protein